MFNLTKLSPGSQSFVSQVASMGRSMSETAAIALARMISAEFTIPSQPVEDVEHYYRIQCEILANNVISEVNEFCPVDAKAALELTRRFFMLRYTMTHPQKNVFSFRADKTVEDFFGLSRVFSDETLKTIRENGTDLAFYANGFRGIHYDICAKSDAEAVALAANQATIAG